MQDFMNKVVFISGGAGGIGSAMARELVEAGAKVAIADLDFSRAQAVAAEIGPQGQAWPVQLDVTDAASWLAARDATEQALGPVSVLCSNAGVSFNGTLDVISVEAWRWVYEVNVVGALHAVRTFLPGMKARGTPGYVLLTCSVTALRPFATEGAYTSSKAALLNFASVLQLELADTSIGVSALCPGMVATDLRSNAMRARTDALKPAATPQPGASPLSQGMTATAVARAAVEAIRQERFHVFTHADYRATIEADAALMSAAMTVSADPAYREPSAYVALLPRCNPDR